MREAKTKYLFKKIMTSLILFMIIPSFIIICLFFSQNYYNSVQEKQNQLNDEIKLKNEIISTLCQKYYNQITLMVQNPILLQALHGTYTQADKVINTLNIYNPMIQWFQSSQQGNERITIYYSSDVFYPSLWFVPLEEYQKTSWYKELTNSYISIPTWGFSDVQPANFESDTQQYVSLFCKIPNKYGNKLAILQYSIPIKNFSQAVESALDSSEYIFFLQNKSNQILYINQNKNIDLLESELYDNKSTILSDNELGYTVGGVFLNNSPLSVYQKLIFPLFSIFILMFIFSIFISYIFAKILTRNITFLSEKISLNNNTNLPDKLPSVGYKEIDILCYSYNEMVDKLNEMINTVYKTNLLKKEADLKLLKSQINPHFLYNSLETIRMQAEINQDLTVSESVYSLSQILRYNLTHIDRTVTIKDEILIINEYCRFNNLLLNNTISIEIDCPENLLEILIPPQTILPLIENAIAYGSAGIKGNCNIFLKIQLQDTFINIRVTNTGQTIPPDLLLEIRQYLYNPAISSFKPKGNGIGLRNIVSRLKFIYNNKANIIMDSEDEVTTVEVNIPIL